MNSLNMQAVRFAAARNSPLPLWWRITYDSLMRRLLPARLAIAAVLLLLPAGPALADGIRTGTNLYWRGDYRAAAAVLKPMAEEGHVLAQFAVAVMYDDGRGLPQDFSRALSWYKKAANAGLVDAQYMLGRFYGGGRGVKQDPSAAFFWFNLAAAAGYPRAAALRDQHRLQISPAQRRRMESEAVSWLTKHPRQFTCRFQRCIYPGWLSRPRWNFLYPQDIQPR
jgi:TPR repeat protein